MSNYMVSHGIGRVLLGLGRVFSVLGLERASLWSLCCQKGHHILVDARFVSMALGFLCVMVVSDFSFVVLCNHVRRLVTRGVSAGVAAGCLHASSCCFRIVIS